MCIVDFDDQQLVDCSADVDWTDSSALLCRTSLSSSARSYVGTHLSASMPVTNISQFSKWPRLQNYTPNGGAESKNNVRYSSRISDLRVAGSCPGWAPFRSGLGQATYTCVPLSPSSIIWYQPGVNFLAGKATVGLVENSGSLPPGLWLMSSEGWVPRSQDQLRAQCS